ncbi:DUF1534 domain-containing protein [Pseudomonas syringae]|nr:DUF1534 domain-containing protein [Pseudomonas syringae]MCF5505722.1 DUF1534 domain-containing protein [Pseudomonas syringae]MCF5541746.1 DUF1534 domain-containing protein [Pseudomonas syringae]MCF5575047.1 DUF1534 domain-containing protein [Pseudomonas syringae]MCF5601052.1 DUF1534 domain-containing protein [Pseudomonas syringae]
MRLSFRTLQRGNACRDALRHLSAWRLELQISSSPACRAGSRGLRPGC